MINWHDPDTLRRAISQTDLTIGEFAKKSGVSRVQLFRLLGGKNKPQWGTQNKIEKALVRLLERGGIKVGHHRRGGQPAQAVGARKHRAQTANEQTVDSGAA